MEAIKILRLVPNFHHLLCRQVKVINFELRKYYIKINYASKSYKGKHFYKNLHPWRDGKEFANHLTSSIVYNKGGLIALNKPFGIKIHRHDKPGARSEPGKHKLVPTIPECDYTIEDALPFLEKNLSVHNLRILKSAEKYTSGVVLLSTNDDVADNVRKSFEAAKRQKAPHLIHWMITLGCPVIKNRKEKVGIKFLAGEKDEPRQPVIVFKFSNRTVKSRIVYPVNVEYKVLAENRPASTSLVEIATSSVVYHFVRVYASTRITPILGDILYGSRMNTVMGVPVRVHIQQAQAYDMQPLSNRMAEALNLPKGLHGHTMMPTMLHLRSISLPSFYGEDVIITASPPTHFQWTAEQLNLLDRCK